MKPTPLALAAILSTFLISGCATPDHLPTAYQGKPYQGQLQEIPGKISCILYDAGGEGVAYHDRESTDLAAVCCGGNFRTNEGVDIGVIADHHKSLSAPLDPRMNYVGWIFEGEWLNYTVRVKEAGLYQLNAHMSSANTNCQIRLLVNGRDRTGPITFPRATGDVHIWDIYTNLARIELPAGVQLLTLQFSKGQKGDQNFDYLEFVPKSP